MKMIAAYREPPRLSRLRFDEAPTSLTGSKYDGRRGGRRIHCVRSITDMRESSPVASPNHTLGSVILTTD